MAYVVSVTSWKTTSIDFNLPFANAPTNSAGPAGTLTSFSGPLSVNGATYSFASESVIAKRQFDSDWGIGNNSQVLGNAISLQANGTIATGLVLGLSLTLNDQFNYGISGFSLSGGVLGAAQNTLSNTDDIAALTKIFKGNDLVFLSDVADVFFAGDGADLIFAGAGLDRITGGGGTDIVVAEAGNDIVSGQAGGDILFGSGGNDQVFGGGGVDYVSGSIGNDTLSGGASGDFFVFELGGGSDVVTDFTKVDRVLIRDPGLSMADLTITQVGVNTNVTFGTTTILFQNVQASLLTSARFIFDGDAQIDTAVAAILTGWDYFV